MNSSQTFRKLVKSDCIPIVGAFNGLVARSIAQNGFFSFKNQNNIILKRFQMLLCFWLCHQYGERSTRYRVSQNETFSLLI